MTAEAILLLPGWPYKAVSDRRKVDIAVCISETFGTDSQTIVKATSKVGYFRKVEMGRDAAIRPLLELHYDFETPIQEAHPVFHVHIDSTQWPVDRLRDLGLSGQIERGGTEFYPNARIPTPFMGFAPVLVALAADHLEPRNFRAMMKAVSVRDAARTEPVCEILAQRLGGTKPHAQHWYDERYVVHQWQKGKNKCKAAIPVLGREFEADDPPQARNLALQFLGVPIGQVQFRDGEPTSIRS